MTLSRNNILLMQYKGVNYNTYKYTTQHYAVNTTMHNYWTYSPGCNAAQYHTLTHKRRKGAPVNLI